jgi:hypothetical protein
MRVILPWGFTVGQVEHSHVTRYYQQTSDMALEILGVRGKIYIFPSHSYENSPLLHNLIVLVY